MKCPCNKCEDRQVGCHSKCEAYRKFRKECIEVNKKIKEETQKNAVSKAAVETRKRRNKSSIYNTHRK